MLERRRLGLDGSVREETALPYEVGARDAVTLPLPPTVASAEDPSREVLLVEAAGLRQAQSTSPEPVEGPRHRAWWWFAEDRDGGLVAADLDAQARAVLGGYEVTVTARCLVKDLAVLADRVAPDAVVDAMLVTLLPGETATIAVTSATDVAPEAFVEPLVLRSANQLLGR